MLLLFVDTETTGVNFSESQIIEIAGLVVSIDPQSLEFTEVDKFSSLVSLRQTMDAKITRITGITELELSTAQNLHKVQEIWANWLENYNNIQAVIGHSIDFDLNFLKKESWYLPSNIKTVDTLELAKIFFPEISAINLEFLQDKFNLVPNLDSEHAQLSHRALYDASVCYLLFRRIIQHIPNLQLSQKFFELLDQHFLPIDLNFFGSNQYSTSFDKKSEVIIESNPVKVDFFGNPIKKHLIEKINSLNPINALSQLEVLLKLDLPREFVLILLQLYALFLHKIKNPNYHLKLHGQSKAVFSFAESVIELVSSEDSFNQPNQSQKVIIPVFESIIGQIRNLVEDTAHLSGLASLLDLYLSIKLHRQKLDQSTLLVEKWIGAYEFLLIALKPHWVNNEFRYYHHLLNHETKVIAKKFTTLCELTDKLKKVKLDNSDNLITIISTKISNIASLLSLASNENYMFRLFYNKFTISAFKKDFNLQNHFTNLLDKIGDLEVETFLQESSFAHLLETIRLEELFESRQVSVHYHDSSVQNNTNELKNDYLLDLTEFFEGLLSNSSNQITVILCGQNSTLKDSQRVLVENFKITDYLILGESGSLTKINSKIEKGFKGLVVTKLGDIFYLLRQKNIPHLKEIWIVNQPYLWFHPFWTNWIKQDRETFTKQLKSIHLRSQLNQISSLSKVEVKFMRSYKV
ncbi:MAG: 3'-5' exonuclease [Patescibacteria group bacterium]